MKLILILATIVGLFLFFSEPLLPKLTVPSETDNLSQVLGHSENIPQEIENTQPSNPVKISAPLLTVPADKVLPTSVSLSGRSTNLEDLVDDDKARIITAPPLQYRYVTASALNVRNRPNTSSAIISRLNYGARVAVVSENPQNWLKISLSDGAEGWVFGKYISPDKPLSANLTTATVPRERTISAPSNAEVRRATTALIQQSIASYAGSCPCPYNRDRGGRRCGKRSAWSRPGGYSPICYDSDVTKARLDSYLARLRGATN